MKNAMLSNSKLFFPIICYFILNEFIRMVLPPEASADDIGSLRTEFSTTFIRFLNENEKRIDHYLKLS
jgi:hypothetical protein